MRRNAWLIGLAVWGVTSIGCVEKRFVVTTDPPGALVLRNGKPIGSTPGDDNFVYYGNYHFTVIKDGYQTQQIDQKVPTPWYEYFPLDLMSEAFLPYHIEDVRRFHYTLEPVQTPNPNELVGRGQTLRDRGHTLQPKNPKATSELAAPPPPTMPSPGIAPAVPLVASSVPAPSTPPTPTPGFAPATGLGIPAQPRQ